MVKHCITTRMLKYSMLFHEPYYNNTINSNESVLSVRFISLLFLLFISISLTSVFYLEVLGSNLAINMLFKINILMSIKGSNNLKITKNVFKMI